MTDALPPSTAKRSGPNDGFWLRIIYITSAVICGAVAFLTLGPRPSGTSGMLDVSALPTVNCTLNLTTGILLVIGWRLIVNKKIAQHRAVMLAAFGSSSAFLVSYLIYHWFKDGPKLYAGDYRGLYLFILLSHIALAAVILPLALVTLYRGWNMQVAKHRAIAKVTLPLWLYVSVTGVAVYVMLHT
jgi:putative membrane protein